MTNLEKTNGITITGDAKITIETTKGKTIEITKDEVVIQDEVKEIYEVGENNDQ